jgi:hypothetical protein
VKVDDIADARAGDKGDTLILVVFPRDRSAWHVLLEHLTAGAVGRHFGSGVTADVTRTEIPGLPGLVFRIPGILDGGVTGSTALDGHGKTLSYHLLMLELPTA